MQRELGRRRFLKGTMAAAAGVTAGFGREEQTLITHLAQASNKESPPAAGVSAAAGLGAPALTPMGRIKDLVISRIICGGNLMGGWAHSRDLIYVSRLFKAYNTDEKIMETLQLCEQHGVNTVLTNPVSAGVINRYWRERGGKIQWISEVHPSPSEVKAGVVSAIDNGACMAYIQGAVGDRLVKQNRLDIIAQTIELVKDQGVPAGVGAHSLEVVIACEKAGVSPDFYVKTLHTGNYWSARRPDQITEVIENPADNFWCVDPEKTIECMKTINIPWIAFKVLAAGAIHPNDGFQYAFDNGADFVCVGMFDFQVAEDAAIGKKVLANLNRQRPWHA
jgi:hypothetical protein